MDNSMINKSLGVTLYASPGSHCVENQTFFPLIKECKGEMDFLKATVCDYTSIRFKGGRRQGENFEAADCLVGDIDNTHSDNPSDWVYPTDIAARLHGVLVFCQYSRNHLKVKDGRPARPKFHFILPITPTTNPAVYKRLWCQLKTVIPENDPQTGDLARFMFGGGLSNKGEFFPGELTFSEFCEINDIEPVSEENISIFQDDFDFSNLGSTMVDRAEFSNNLIIPGGKRNGTLFKLACKYYRHNLGNPNCDNIVWNNLLYLAQKHCSPPFSEDELKAVFKSAKRYAAKDKSNALSVLSRINGDDEVVEDG